MGQSVLLLLTFTLCLVVVQSLYVPTLSTVLRSPGETLMLYNSYKKEQNLKFGANENRQRFRLFKSNANLVANFNSDPEETAWFEMNFFSSMTENEKKDWTGLNMTEISPVTESPQSTLSSPKCPKRKSWIKEGAVTDLKVQGSCGSCWAFSAIATFETRYKLKSDRLRSFSDQQFLDCTYEDQERWRGKDGCKGGKINLAWDSSIRSGGRIAAASDYPYTGYDGKCRSDSVHDAAVAAKLKKVIRLSSQTAVIQALASGAVSLGVYVDTKFSSYKGGILREYICETIPNHAVTAVAYTKEFVLIKNSYGKIWGDGGFIKMARKEGRCSVPWRYGFYPEVESTGKMDSGDDDVAVRYDDGEEYDDQDFSDDEFDDDDKSNDEEYNDDDESDGMSCKDNNEFCIPEFCEYKGYAADWCRKTCGYCEKDDKEDDESDEDDNKFDDNESDDDDEFDDEDEYDDEDEDECDDDDESDDMGYKDKHKLCLPDFCKFKPFARIWCRKTCRPRTKKCPCKDKYQDCVTGFCDYPYFANHYCKKSCGLCKPDSDRDF